ncbi:MAG: hypothetical protein ACREBE_09175, partial [bacterium]
HPESAGLSRTDFPDRERIMSHDLGSHEPSFDRASYLTPVRDTGERRRHDDVPIRAHRPGRSPLIAWQILPLDNLMHVRLLGAVKPTDVEQAAAAARRDRDFSPGLRAFFDLRSDPGIPRSTTATVAEAFIHQASALHCDRVAVLVSDRSIGAPATRTASRPVRVFDDALAALKWLDEAR